MAMSFCLLAGLAAWADDTELPHRLIEVPVDHFDDQSGTFDLYVEFAEPFDPNKPTVFFLADGQQFFIRQGSMARHRDRLFSDDMNVVGIVGRGVPDAYPDLAAMVGDDIATADWEMAWTLYRSAQWIEDIETVRRSLMGAQGKVILFGRSGGGALVHEYAAKYGEYVSRAFTAAPALSSMANYTRLPFDRFWAEVEDIAPDAHERFRTLMNDPDIDRHELAVAFQRQNFFVTPDERDAERLRLLTTYEKRDAEMLAEMLTAYQVPQMAAFDAAPISIPSRVRLMEFRLPHVEKWRVEDDKLNPDIENILLSSAPVHDAFLGDVPVAEFSLTPLHELKETQVYILAGAHDHVVDYRGSIALAASYPSSAIFIADDGHTFPAMVDDGSYRDILVAFLMHGLGSEELQQAEAAAALHHYGG
nr:hypothetical protein GCM10011355_08140 [Aquisalinus luteolus]